jgi:hypothetical protein
MPIFIENATVEATVTDGDMPLTAAQIEKLVKLVLARLAAQEQDSQARKNATRLRNHSLPDDLQS